MSDVDWALAVVSVTGLSLFLLALLVFAATGELP